jgi:hypothetical protein
MIDGLPCSGAIPATKPVDLGCALPFSVESTTGEADYFSISLPIILYGFQIAPPKHRN